MLKIEHVWAKQTQMDLFTRYAPCQGDQSVRLNWNQGAVCVRNIVHVSLSLILKCLSAFLNLFWIFFFVRMPCAFVWCADLKLTHFFLFEMLCFYFIFRVKDSKLAEYWHEYEIEVSLQRYSSIFPVKLLRISESLAFTSVGWIDVNELVFLFLFF